MNASASRKATNLTLDATLLSQARSLRVNLSRAAEDGIRREITRAQRQIWLAENRAALESSNAYVSEHGLPLDSHRQF